MSTDIRRTRPRYAITEVRRESGWAIGGSAGQAKVTAMVLGLCASDVSRQMNGHRDGVVGRFYQTVRQLVEDSATEAGHVLAGALAVAEEEASRLSEHELRERLYRALEAETEAQAAEDRAEYRVARALGENAADLRDALEAHDEAVRAETAAHINALIYNRALRVARGWRTGPGGGA